MSGSSVPRIIVDASIACKLYLLDETFTQESDRLFHAYRTGETQLIAPDHIRYEVASALRNAVRRGRLTGTDAHVALHEFLAWRIPTFGSDDLIETSYSYALTYGCNFYDALYLALADMVGCPFVYADQVLHRIIGGRFARALWIEDVDLAQLS